MELSFIHEFLLLIIDLFHFFRFKQIRGYNKIGYKGVIREKGANLHLKLIYKSNLKISLIIAKNTGNWENKQCNLTTIDKFDNHWSDGFMFKNACFLLICSMKYRRPRTPRRARTAWKPRTGKRAYLATVLIVSLLFFSQEALDNRVSLH